MRHRTARWASASNGIEGGIESSNTSRGGFPVRRRRQFLALVVPLACLSAWGISRVGFAQVDDDPGRPERASDTRPQGRDTQGAKTWTTAVAPKPLSRHVRSGLEWLLEHQLPSGGWG